MTAQTRWFRLRAAKGERPWKGGTTEKEELKQAHGIGNQSYDMTVSIRVAGSHAGRGFSPPKIIVEKENGIGDGSIELPVAVAISTQISVGSWRGGDEDLNIA